MMPSCQRSIKIVRKSSLSDSNNTADVTARLKARVRRKVDSEMQEGVHELMAYKHSDKGDMGVSWSNLRDAGEEDEEVEYGEGESESSGSTRPTSAMEPERAQTPLADDTGDEETDAPATDSDAEEMEEGAVAVDIKAALVPLPEDVENVLYFFPHGSFKTFMVTSRDVREWVGKKDGKVFTKMEMLQALGCAEEEEEEDIVATVILRTPIAVRQLREAFMLGSIMDTDMYVDGADHGVLLRLHVLPIFRPVVRLILRECMRQVGIGALHVLSPSGQPIDRVVLDGFIPVPARRRQLVSASQQSIAEVEACPFVLPSSPSVCLLSGSIRTMCDVRPQFNARIVVVGASDVGAAVLMSLVLEKGLRLPLLTLVSDGDLERTSERRNPFFPSSATCFDGEMQRSSLVSYVRTIRDRLRSIDRSKKVLLLESGAVVKYDYVILATGVQCAAYPLKRADVGTVYIGDNTRKRRRRRRGGDGESSGSVSGSEYDGGSDSNSFDDDSSSSDGEYYGNDGMRQYGAAKIQAQTARDIAVEVRNAPLTGVFSLSTTRDVLKFIDYLEERHLINPRRSLKAEKDRVQRRINRRHIREQVVRQKAKVVLEVLTCDHADVLRPVSRDEDGEEIVGDVDDEGRATGGGEYGDVGDWQKGKDGAEDGGELLYDEHGMPVDPAVAAAAAAHEKERADFLAREELRKAKEETRESDSTIVIYGGLLGAYTILRGLLDSGVPGSSLVHVVPSQKRGTIPAFDDLHVQQVVSASIVEQGVRVVDGYDLFQLEKRKNHLFAAVFLFSMSNAVTPGKLLEEQMKLHDNDYERAAAALRSSRSARRIPCCTLICADEYRVDADMFRAISESFLVFDGRLVIDAQFRTTDECILSAGSLTKFARRFAADMSLQHFDSREVGRLLSTCLTSQMAEAVCSSTEAEEMVRREEEEATGVQRAVRLSERKAVSCILPGRSAVFVRM